MVPKKMLFQSQWQLFKFESLKETGSFSGFLCSEFSSLLCFRFKEGKKKPQPCLSGFRHIWEFTASSRCPLPEDVYGTIFLRSQEHRAWPFSLPPPPALQHQVTTTTWRCSAVENPHSDFLVLVGASRHRQPFSGSCCSIKRCSLNCLHLTEHPNLRPEQPKVLGLRRKGAIFVEIHCLILVGATEMSKWKITLV